MVSEDYLQGVDVFEGLGRDEIERLLTLCEELTWEGDTTVFAEGDPARFLYVLVTGRVDLRLRLRLFKRRFFVTKEDRSRELTVTSVPQAKAFGWAALTKPSEYEVSAHCLEPCQLIRIDGEKLLAHCQQFPQTGFYVMRNLATIISQRLKAHRQQLEKEVEAQQSRWW